MRQVSNAPLREAFLAGGIEAGAVCLELGWIDKRGYAERSRLRRLLGTLPMTQRGHKQMIATMIAEDKARAISAAMGVSFEDLYPETAVSCGAECERCGNPMIEPAELCGFCVEEAMLV